MTAPTPTLSPTVQRVRELVVSYRPFRFELPIEGTVTGPQDAVRLASAILAGTTVEHVLALHFDTKRKLMAISEFPKWSKYLILLSFQDNSSARSVQIGGWDVNICHSRVDCSPRTPAVQFAIPSPGAILSHTDGPCGS